jgi:hypothetical protein
MKHKNIAIFSIISLILISVLIIGCTKITNTTKPVADKGIVCTEIPGVAPGRIIYFGEEYCDKCTGYGYRGICYGYVASLKENPALCDKLEDNLAENRADKSNVNKEGCIREYESEQLRKKRVSENNFDGCFNVSDTFEYICRGQIAFNLKNASLCNTIEVWARPLCMGVYAFLSKDKSYCSLTNQEPYQNRTTSQEGCIATFNDQYEILKYSII